MSLQTELDGSLGYQVNLVIKVSGSDYFSRHQVDSGLTVDSDKVGTIDSANLNPSNVDLRRIKSVIKSAKIKVLDLDEVFTNYIGNSDTSLIGDDLELHVGLITGSFAWADYVKIADYQINMLTKTDASYRIIAKSQEFLITTPFFNVKGQLTNNINNSVTSIDVETDSDIFQSANFLKIDDEFIQYTGTSFSGTTTTFTGCTRGSLNSTADSHDAGAETLEVTKLEENPIDAILQLIISDGGGGAYDVLHDGCGVDNTKVDITGIEGIKTDFFPSDTFRLYLYDIENALEYIEEELLFPCNLRFIDTSNGLSLAVLDQVTPGSTTEVLDSTNTLPRAQWSVKQDKIVNEFEIRWNWNEGQQKFTRVSYFEDTDSKDIFGTRRGSTFEFKGVVSDLSGSSVVTDRGNRFLARFSTPQAEIGTTSFLKKYSLNPGDKVNFAHPHLPQQGGGLGINAELEIVSKALDLKTGLVKFKLAYTSYYGLRLGLICPSHTIAGITSQKVFDVADATHYKAGYFLQLWDEVNQVYFADAANEIDSVSGNTITMKNDWTTTLQVGNVRIKFANFDDSSAEQKGRYMYIGDSSGFFTDGSKSYQIDF